MSRQTSELYKRIEGIIARREYVLLDTNVLLEILLSEREQNESNLTRIIGRGAKLLVTPQILSEFFNLKERMNYSEKNFEIALQSLLASVEKYVPKNVMLEKESVREFGVTDLSLIEALNSSEYKKKVFLITDDEKLRGHCQKVGLPALSSVEVNSFGKI